MNTIIDRDIIFGTTIENVSLLIVNIFVLRR